MKYIRTFERVSLNKLINIINELEKIVKEIDKNDNFEKSKIVKKIDDNIVITYYGKSNTLLIIELYNADYEKNNFYLVILSNSNIKNKNSIDFYEFFKNNFKNNIVLDNDKNLYELRLRFDFDDIDNILNVINFEKYKMNIDAKKYNL